MLVPVVPGDGSICDMGFGERISLKVHDAAVLIVVYFSCIQSVVRSP